MTKEDYEKLERKREEIIGVEDLRDVQDRTLLYGYTCERETFHVYIKDKEIHVVVYKNEYSNDGITPKGMGEIKVSHNRDYIPDKRLYPEACDYDFCRLLKEAGIYLPFTGYQSDREKEDFYGFTL